MVVALPVLAEIAFWFGCLIFLVLCAAIAKALFGTLSGGVGWIPFAGKLVQKPINQVAQKINNVMASAIAAVDRNMGAALHRIARIIDWMGREIKSHAILLTGLAAFMFGSASNQLVKLLVGELRKIVHDVQRQATALLHKVEAIPHTIARGIGEDVLPRIRSAEREAHRELVRERARAKAVERNLDRDITNLWKWTRSHTILAGTLAFASAVVLALSRLGLGWLRCSNTQKVGERVCGMDASLAEKFLLDTLGLIGTVSLIEFIRDAQAVEGVALEALGGFIREMPGA